MCIKKGLVLMSRVNVFSYLYVQCNCELWSGYCNYNGRSVFAGLMIRGLLMYRNTGSDDGESADFLTTLLLK